MRSPSPLIAVVLASLASLAPPPAHAAGCDRGDARPTADALAPAVLATVCLVNERRAAAGLEPLTLDMGLMAVGFGYAREMVAGGFYDHVAPDGAILADRLAVIGYHPYAAGENMYWGDVHVATPADAVVGWMGSYEHRRNLLQPEYRRIGVGIALGTPEAGVPGGATYVAELDSGPGGTASDGSPTTDVIATEPPVAVRGGVDPDARPALRVQRTVIAWFEAARLGQSSTFCRLEDNHLLRATYGRDGRAGRTACEAAFRGVPALPPPDRLEFSRFHARGIRASLTVRAAGRRVILALRKFNGRWKLHAVVRPSG